MEKSIWIIRLYIRVLSLVHSMDMTFRLCFVKLQITGIIRENFAVRRQS